MELRRDILFEVIILFNIWDRGMNYYENKRRESYNNPYEVKRCLFHDGLGEA